MEVANFRIEENFKNIYDKYFNLVYRIGLLYLKSTSETEDLVQEVFIKLLQEKSKFNDEEHIKTWLIRVSKNLCKDKIKSFWKSRRVDINNLPEISDQKEDLSYVLESLLSIPTKYKISLYLFYYEGYKVKDISKILNIKESTIQTRLSRGRKILEKKIKERSYE